MCLPLQIATPVDLHGCCERRHVATVRAREASSATWAVHANRLTARTTRRYGTRLAHQLPSTIVDACLSSLAHERCHARAFRGSARPCMVTRHGPPPRTCMHSAPQVAQCLCNLVTRVPCCTPRPTECSAARAAALSENLLLSTGMDYTSMHELHAAHARRQDEAQLGEEVEVGQTLEGSQWSWRGTGAPLNSSCCRGHRQPRSNGCVSCTHTCMYQVMSPARVCGSLHAAASLLSHTGLSMQAPSTQHSSAAAPPGAFRSMSRMIERAPFKAVPAPGQMALRRTPAIFPPTTECGTRVCAGELR